jgi:hypothetical protein
MPTDAYTLPLLPRGNTFAQFIDNARNFMSWNTGKLNSGSQSLFREHVTVANATGLHLDPHVSCTQFRDLAFDDLEIAPGLEICATFIVATAIAVVAINPTMNFQISFERHLLVLSRRPIVPRRAFTPP